MMLIPKATSSIVTIQMMGYQIDAWVIDNANIARKKWEARKHNKVYIPTGEGIPRLNALIGVPNEFCTIIRNQFKLCPACKKVNLNLPMSEYHLDKFHNIDIPGYEKIWECITSYYFAKIEELEKRKKSRKNRKDPFLKLKRGDFRKYWDDKFKELLQLLERKTQPLFIGA